MRLKTLIIGLISLTLGTATSDTATAAGQSCKTDVDCPGDDICKDARCVDPAGGGSRGAPAAKSCKTDVDCPGDDICNDARCVNTAGNPGGGAAAARACKTDVDCPGENICKDARCVDLVGSPGAAAPVPTSKPAATAPEKPARRAAGTRRTVRKELRKKKQQKTPAAPKARRRHTAWLITAIAAGAAAAGTLVWGAVAGGQGQTAAERHDRGEFDSRYTQQRVAYGLSIGLGAVSAAALVLYLVTGKEAPRARAAKHRGFNLAAGPGSAGLSAAWRY